MTTANLSTRNYKDKYDIWLIIITVSLLFFGLLAIYDASVVSAFRDFNDKYYFFKNQLTWASIGSVALIFFTFLDYKKLLKFSPTLLLISIFLLMLVLIPGIGSKIYGARRWINIAGFSFQPSEVTKLALILYETAILSKFKGFSINLKDTALVFFLPAIVAIALVVFQPDLGTALIFVGLTMVIYFLGEAPIKHFLITIPPLLITILIAIALAPYRLTRIKSFLDPTFDPQGASYQINQILTAIASGGIFGVGIGASRAKFAFIPEVHSDAIFAIIVEELGFIGALVLIVLFVLLTLRALDIAKKCNDPSGKLLACAIAALFAIQSLFNIASNVALVPLTGIPLPFISYGGTSLLVTMIGIGILNNIKKNS